MRVTGSMLSSGLLANLYANLENMNRYQNQISTERKILRVSDDPIGAAKAMQTEGSLDSNEQYARNINDAVGWLEHTEAALMDMNEVVVRARELAVQISSGTYTCEQRIAAAEEVRALREHFVDLANAKYMGKYIFGGYNTMAQPFTVNEETISYNSINDLSRAKDEEIAGEACQVQQYRLSDSTAFDVSISGIQIMGAGAGNVFNVFQEFINALSAPGSVSDLNIVGDRFSSVQDNMLTLLADIGGRQTRLDLVTQRYQSENYNLNDVLNKTAGIDKAELITQYEMARVAYNTALQVGAQIIQLSLADFLR